MRRIALHEPLALAVGKIPAFAACAFRDQHSRAIDAGRMELHELHVLQRQSGAQHHRIAVPGAGVRRRTREIGAPVAARRQDRALRTERMDRSVFKTKRHNTPARAVCIHQQIDGEILDEEFGRMPQGLAVERVQHRMAGAVSGCTRALRWRPLAKLGRHATKRALVDLAVLSPAERHAVMLKLIDRRRRIPAKILDRILVAEPIGTFDGVVHMPFPAIRPHIPQGRSHAPLRRNGVRPGWKHLRHARGPQASFRRAQRRAQSSAASADNDNVVFVVCDGIRGAIELAGASCFRCHVIRLQS